MLLQQKTALTGIKPTGTPHLGNYVGAIKPMLAMLREAKQTFVFIADLHALNAVQERQQVVDNTYEVAATFLALGLDPARAVLFRQSDVPEVYMLATLLMNVTPKGLMNRSHAYKATVDKNTSDGIDADVGVNMGLYTYPILMAADILLYGADVVPVGQDQKQHVEFARDIAGSFNHIYGDILVMPEPVIQATANAIPGLDGRKMSKSYGNTIPIFAPPAELSKLVMRIVTDSKRPEEPKDPDSSTIYQLYLNFATPEEAAALRERFLTGGMGYGDAKKALLQVIDRTMTAPRERYAVLMADRAKIDALLKDGAARARPIAAEILGRVTTAMLGRPLKCTTP